MADVTSKSNVFYRGPLRKAYPTMDRGEGIYLFDDEGNRYIDAKGGIAVVNVGYGVKEIVNAIAEQAEKLSYAFTIQFTTRAQEELAGKLAEFSPEGLDKVWFSLSGTEANETAIKIARQYHLETGNSTKYKVISTWNSYHGHTLGSLSLSGKVSWRKPYTPYLINFPHIFPANCYRCYYGQEYPGCDIFCAYELERVIKQEDPDYVSAVIMEPIIAGTAGVVIPPPEYFTIIRSICDRHNVVMIVDEVFTGIGRTGRNFAIDHWNVIPDVIATAKGIAGGYMPLGATVIHRKIYDAIYEGSGQFVHGITFSGHPVACAAGVATLQYLEEHNLIERSARMGDYFLEKLSVLREIPMVGDIRGKGLLMGIEFVADRKTKAPFAREVDISRKVTSKAFEKGLIVQPGFGGIDGTLGDHILLAPPFIIQESEIDKAVEILEVTCKEVETSL